MFDIEIKPTYHLGHIMMESMRKHSTLLAQIDGATGQEETFGSMLSRSIRLAKSLRNVGFKPGDVLAVSGWNHLDIHIPYYSGLFNGLPVFGIDPFFKYDEIKELFKITKPKIAFCENDSYDTYVKVTNDLELVTKIITFGEGENSLKKFMNSNDDNEPEEKFKIAEFDIDEIYPVLMATSGTTGKVKVVAFTQQPLALKHLTYAKECRDFDNFTGTKALHLAPVNWISTLGHVISTPFIGQCVVQTSIMDDIDIVVNMINKYKPITFFTTPTMVETLLKQESNVDLTCFNYILVTGAKVYPELLIDLQVRMKKDARVYECYGQTEAMGKLLKNVREYPAGSCGNRSPFYDMKIVDPNTRKEITEPNVCGELLVKGPCFKEYYEDPEETRNAFTEDGYYKTNDLLYRDENGFYFYVDRLKTIIKWRTCTILPAELEELIRSHKGVADCCVVGIDDPEDGQRPVACVVRENGSQVTAQEIKDLVINKLSQRKELRGGVVFLDEFPMTSSGKIARGKLHQVVLNSIRE